MFADAFVQWSRRVVELIVKYRSSFFHDAVLVLSESGIYGG